MVKAPSRAAHRAAEDNEATREPLSGPADRRLPSFSWAGAAVGITLVAGIVLRFVAPSPLWLDEALSVNIAELPLGEIPSALLRDGAPPLYYFLLHLWMELFGTGDLAVRALSGVISIATLPAVWLAGRRLGGQDGGRFALLFAAASPFAIRYATETRMYSLVMFLVAWGFVALHKTLRERSLPSAVGVALAAGALALTHYWALYLLLVTGALVAYRAFRKEDRGARIALVALVLGGLMWLPWVSNFLYQLRHTGTPWASSPPFGSLLTPVTFWAGGPLRTGPVLGAIFLGLLVLALFGRAAVDKIELRRLERPEAGAILLVVFGTLLVGYVAGVIGNSTFADRYTSVVWPLFVIVAALGLIAIGNHRVRNALLALVVLLGLFNGVGNLTLARSQADEVVDAIVQGGSPGDVVAFCPDQLGPAVARRLPDHFDQVVFPTGAGPHFVDWVDYAERNRAADPLKFARSLESRAGDAAIWLVSAPGYKTFGRKCAVIEQELAGARPGGEIVVHRKTKAEAWEREELSVYPAP